MTDYTELKRLAETANAVTGDVSVEMTLASEPGPNQAEVDAVTAFFGAATPAAVLALIADRDQLKAENELLESSRAKLAGELSRLRAKHKDWSVSAAMGNGERS